VDVPDDATDHSVSETEFSGDESEVKALKRRLKRMRGERDEFKRQLIAWKDRAELSEAQILRAPSSNTQSQFSLALVMPPDIGSVTTKCYKKSGFLFPHYVTTESGGMKTYLIENRIKSRIICRLIYRPTESRVTEFDVIPSGKISFKLEILFADSNIPVTDKLLKNVGQYLVDPPEELASAKSMSGGEVQWNFKFAFSSRNTPNGDGRFKVRISPITSGVQNMVVTTPPFKIITRVPTKKKVKEK
jgi:hypothetical protein